MTIQTTDVRLPDGRVLQISSANAEQIATILERKLTRNVSARTMPLANTEEEEPMEVPVMNFEAKTRHMPDNIIRNVPTNEESPLELPVMNFSKARPDETHDAPEANDDALALPSTF
jgi:hypothetical protein